MNRLRHEGGFTLIELLIVVAIIGIIASIAVPNLMAAIDRGKQRKTMADMRVLGNAVETYAIDNNFYPIASSGVDLGTHLTPVHLKRAITNDGWSRSFAVQTSAVEYTLCSGGKDGGVCLSDAAGPTKSVNASITYANGNFVQWPEGEQR